MDRAEVLQRVREHLATELEVDIDRIGDETRFKEDLDADSLDLLELMMELEDTYGVRISDEEAARISTVGQAADHVASHLAGKASWALTSLARLVEELPAELRRQAFTHSSWVDRRADSYERLAFLGDVVLSLAVSTHLYPRFPMHGAGRLTKLRAQAVARQACADVARDLAVHERLREHAPAGTGKSADLLAASDRIMASICEAVIGACYLAFGFERTAPAVVEAFSEQVEDALANPVDYKSVLQETLARRAEVVVYRIEVEEGPPHARRFVAAAYVDGEEIGRGEGRTKKAAEQGAAQVALQALEED